MRSVNKVILVGNLTRDPELRQTPNGQAVCTFGIATNREWVAKDSEKHSSAEFHELVAWARLADVCGKYLKKGKLIYVEGYLKTRSWDTPEGTRKHKTEIIVQDMIMLDKKEEGGHSESRGKSRPSSATVPVPSPKTSTPEEPSQDPETPFPEEDLFGDGLPGEASSESEEEHKNTGSVDI